MIRHIKVFKRPCSCGGNARSLTRRFPWSFSGLGSMPCSLSGSYSLQFSRVGTIDKPARRWF